MNEDRRIVREGNFLIGDILYYVTYDPQIQGYRITSYPNSQLVLTVPGKKIGEAKRVAKEHLRRLKKWKQEVKEGNGNE